LLHLAGKNGEYNYNSPTDQHLVRFLGLDLEALLKELATGKADGEILEWVHAQAKTPHTPWEIEAWSAYMEKRGPDSDAETLSGFAEYVGHTARPAKTSRRGSTPLISTTSSASAVKHDQTKNVFLRC
jgi:Domain of unknown function (DUF5069)